MHPDVTLVEALHSRDLPDKAVITAARFYVAERLAQPGIDDLFDDLSLLTSGAPGLIDHLADDAGLLREAAFALLDTAWSDPAERPRVGRALDHVPGRLPVLDPYALAVLVLYGIFLLRKTERKITRTFGDESWSVEESGALAVLLGLARRDPGHAAAATPARRTAPELPGEGHFSLLLLDIQRSMGMAENDRLRAVGWLTGTTNQALRALGAEDAQIRERGDGLQIVVPETLVSLTTLVEKFPPLIAGPLGRYPLPLRIRLGIHTDLLVHTGVHWGGEGLSFLARLTDTEEAKRQLASSPERRLATVLSTRVHEETIWRGRTDGTRYEPIVLKLDGKKLRVWLALS